VADIIYTFEKPVSERDIEKASLILNSNGIISYQLESNWAIGCDAAAPKALERLRRLKPAHPSERPFSLICDSISMASGLAELSNAQYRYLKRAWPGPFTILLKSKRTLPKLIKDRRKVVGIRIPERPFIRALVKKLGRPLATTSVPECEGLSPRFGYQVEELCGHGIDTIFDLGIEMTGEGTTIIDFSEVACRLVRQGLGDVNLFDLKED
jgi:tRNA threonylcarbamoyl adenosine modification protein (Sua5/YciO/YrdC/YwlC family)